MRVFEEPEKPARLELQCEKCGKVATYDVGRVVMPPNEAPNRDSEYGFTAYFRCRQCRAAGPWSFTTKGTVGMIALMDETLDTKGDGGRLFFGKLALYDGTAMSSPAEGEDILRARLESDPGNAFLWSRLGNLLDNNGQTQPAKDAYARALEINDADLESHFRLGQILGNEKAFDDAAAHLHKVLRLGRTDTAAPPKLRCEIVITSLKYLFEMSMATNDRIKVLPPPSPEYLSALDAEPPVLQMKSYDIRSEKDLWKACLSMAAAFLRKDEAPDPDFQEAAAHITEAAAQLDDEAPDEEDLDEDEFMEETLDDEDFDDSDDGDDIAEGDENGGPIIAAPRVGRNDPCPCGSGKKFKKCCGRA